MLLQIVSCKINVILDCLNIYEYNVARGNERENAAVFGGIGWQRIW